MRSNPLSDSGAEFWFLFFVDFRTIVKVNQSVLIKNREVLVSVVIRTSFGRWGPGTTKPLRLNQETVSDRPPLPSNVALRTFVIRWGNWWFSDVIDYIRNDSNSKESSKEVFYIKERISNISYSKFPLQHQLPLYKIYCTDLRVTFKILSVVFIFLSPLILKDNSVLDSKKSFLGQFQMGHIFLYYTCDPCDFLEVSKAR